ncbi:MULTISPECIES: class I SAM-dependent methyltransferase [Phenylobacterium]|uniref:SAM-dependent methyltransferase n=1 Tax=Phenylobacterium koreense TaxID=266125 RepID=A0ABV2EF08_9CAUL
MTRPDRSAAEQFHDSDVVESYGHRPDYPPELYDALLDLAPSRDCILDLGCGPGKIARAIAARVKEVYAVDPSPLMLSLGQSLDAGRHPNIRWIESAAETLELSPGALDLAVAGASIHWMRPEDVFPNLVDALRPSGIIAIVDGDEPAQAPWHSAYLTVISGWVERLGGKWKGPAHQALMTAHTPWIDEGGELVFVSSVEQSLEDFLASQHSRATWSRARMGELANAFDDDIRAALTPWTRDGKISFEVHSRLLWGRPRRAAR